MKQSIQRLLSYCIVLYPLKLFSCSNTEYHGVEKKTHSTQKKGCFLIVFATWFYHYGMEYIKKLIPEIVIIFRCFLRY